MAEGRAHGNTPASFKINDEESSTASEGSDAVSDTPLDLTWKPEQDTLTKEQNKMRYPMADASSHVPSKSGKTLEHSHFTERRERLHRHEQAQLEEGNASSEAMKEGHHQEIDDKDSLSLAPMELPHQSVVSTEDGVYSCPQCTYTTKHRGHMNTHLYRHTGERPFRCDECARSFTQQIHLRNHILTHTGERPFACTHCSASFKRKSTLISHVRNHTGELPFSCVHCRKCFSEKAKLVRHIRDVHTGERPFSCVHCDASFSRKNKLARHMSKCGANKKP